MAIFFITFEDAPHHYPWSFGQHDIVWTSILYLSTIVLILAWKWELSGAVSMIGFIATYIHIFHWSEGLYKPAGLFVCCIPGCLYLVLILLKLTGKQNQIQ